MIISHVSRNRWLLRLVELAILLHALHLNPSRACAEPLDEVSTQLRSEDNDILSDAVTRPESQLFYDARVIGFDRKQNRTMFEGDVVVIGAGTIISADYITLHRDDGSLNAKGHVVVVTANEVFTGETLTYFWESGNLKITGATFVVQGQEKISEITDQVMGFTPKELYFEAQRADRLKYLAEQKAKMLSDYRKGASFGDQPPAKLVDKYALILEQEELVESIPNTALAKLTERRRESYIKRRQFWEKSKGQSGIQTLGPNAYFRIQGRVLARTDGNDFHAEESDLTFCRCDEDESPAWGFNANIIDAQPGGYVDMTDAVLEIKGLPILYLPHLKLPIKSVRQSGFLFPTLRTGDSRLGTVYTQPVYFAFARNLDSTLTTDFYQERGTRLGWETRYEHSKFEGLSLNIETIRDKVWIDQRHTRETLQDYYQSDDYPYDDLPGLDEPICQGGTEEEREACLRDNVLRPLAIAPNTWRGTKDWSGRFFVTPRISLASQGNLRSDHRYVEDLQLTDNFEAAFTPTLFANSYNIARGRMSYGGQNLAASITASYGDHVMIPDESFTGLQVPGRIDLASRYAELTGGLSPIPIYGNIEYSAIPIQDREGGQEDLWGATTTLGSGRWQKLTANYTAPIKNEGIFTIFAFGNAQTRRIQHSGPGIAKARMHAFQSGLTFNLPLDGVGKVPNWLRSGDTTSSERYVHHSMNWSMTLSTRPVVVRRGDYGDYTDEKGAPLVYFNSDRKSPSGNLYAPEDAMFKHRYISFNTSHSWSTYQRSWTHLSGQPKSDSSTLDDAKKPEPLTYKQRAAKELMFSTDQMVSSVDDMFTSKAPDPVTGFTKKELKQLTPRQLQSKLSELDEMKLNNKLGLQAIDWHINRYRLQEQNRIVPLSISAGILFDYEQEKLRQEQIQRNKELEEQGRNDEIVAYFNLPRSWHGPNFNINMQLAGFSLNTAIDYDMYERTSRRIHLDLAIPPFYSSTLGLSYILEKAPQYNAEENSLTYQKTSTSTVNLSSSLIPFIATDILFIRKTVEGTPKPTYETQFGFTYLSDSDCWGLRFLRSKPLNEPDERNANYLLQLTVIFMGQSRSQDVSAPLIREFKEEPES